MFRRHQLRAVVRSEVASVFITYASCIAFLLLLATRKQPLPFMDDLFYTGAALEMANGGPFTNPTIRLQGFPDPRFFIYPPFHSYLLAGWLALFGTSTTTMLGFTAACVLVTALALHRILMKLKAPHWFLLPLVLAFSVTPMGAGLRAEPAGIALFSLGLLALSTPGMLGMFCAGALLPASVLTAPRLLVISPVFVLVYLVYHLVMRRNTVLRLRLPEGLAALLGLLTVAFLFSQCIDFDYRAFLQCMTFHNSRTPTGTDHILDVLRLNFAADKYSVLLRLPHLLAAVLGASALVLYTDGGVGQRRTLMPSALLTSAGLLSLLGAYMFNAFHYDITFFLLKFVALVVAVQMLLSRYTVARTLALAYLLYLVSTSALYHRSALHGEDKARQTPLFFATATHTVLAPAELRSIIAERRLVGDIWTARYLLDYRLPRDFVAWEWGAPFPGGPLANPNARCPGDVWVVSELNRRDDALPLMQFVDDARTRLSASEAMRHHVFYVIF